MEGGKDSTLANRTLTLTKNDGNSTVVTVTLPGIVLASDQVNTRKASYVDAHGNSIEATVQLPGYSPTVGNE